MPNVNSKILAKVGARKALFAKRKASFGWAGSAVHTPAARISETVERESRWPGWG